MKHAQQLEICAKINTVAFGMKRILAQMSVAAVLEIIESIDKYT